MEGRLRAPMLICLQETSGSFGPVVQGNMFKPRNLVIKCSKSGKMDKQMMKDFVQSVLQPNITDNKACLILDSWSGQRDSQLYELPGMDIQVKIRLNFIIQPQSDPYQTRTYYSTRRV